MSKKYRFTIVILAALLLNTQLASAGEELNMRREHRRVLAHEVKTRVAEFDEKKKPGCQLQNGDEKRYKDLRGSFGKTLEHKACGFIKRPAFESLVCALLSGKPRDFEKILLGDGIVKLVNPQGCFAYSLAANDGWINTLPPAPPFASSETSAEMVELYWTVLVRDVPFNRFHCNPIVALAVGELSKLKGFKGPKIDGKVTPQTFLRGDNPADLIGPYISQFLYQPMPFGSRLISPYLRVPKPGKTNDFNTDFDSWFTVINGGLTGHTIDYAADPTFIRTARDLTEYVHSDTPIQAALTACMILSSYGNEALDCNNPYLHSGTQTGFVTFGMADLQGLLMASVEEALKAAWYQKWQLNRRLRPEEYAFYVQQQLVDGRPLCIPTQLLESLALREIYESYGSFFLPQAYPEGAPAHPSYPSGHAALIGAAVTILKAYFNEEFIIPHPVHPNSDNSALVPYEGPALTVGGELDKLAGNIAMGRDHAGVHYRSDAKWGLRLGEKVAIDLLNNWSFLYNENFKGFHLTTFDGEKILVGGKCCGH